MEKQSKPSMIHTERWPGESLAEVIESAHQAQIRNQKGHKTKGKGEKYCGSDF